MFNKKVISDHIYKKNNIGNASSNWEVDQVALTVVVQPVYFEPMVETFTISFSDLNSNGVFFF